MYMFVLAVCTSCNLHRFIVQIATCTESQFVHDIYITCITNEDTILLIIIIIVGFI